MLAVFIDGAADLMKNPNDIEEASQLVEDLNMLAMSLNLAIITVVHENAGSEVGKARGHLGSELERKVETNLRVQKDPEGVSYIWAERARHCDIPMNKGVAFSWDDEKHMHVTRGVAGVIKREVAIKAKESKKEAKEIEKENELRCFASTLNYPITREELKRAIIASSMADVNVEDSDLKRKRVNRVIEKLLKHNQIIAGVGDMFVRHPVEDDD